MTVFERWTLYLTAAGVLISMGMQIPDLYYLYFRKVQSLVVVPLDAELLYTPRSIQYLVAMTFINDGDEDVVLRGFRLFLDAKDQKSKTVQITERMELPWKVSSFVLRAGDEATFQYVNESVWEDGFLRCSREEPMLTRAMDDARLQFFFEASTLQHRSTLRQFIDINLSSRRMGQLVGGSQAPYREDFARLDQKRSTSPPMPPTIVSVTTAPPC